jgi:hypothetical protein
LQKQTRRLGAPGGVHKKRVMEIVDPRLVVNLPPRAVHKAAMLTYHCLRCTDGQHVFKNYHKKIFRYTKSLVRFTKMENKVAEQERSKSISSPLTRVAVSITSKRRICLEKIVGFLASFHTLVNL